MEHPHFTIGNAVLTSFTNMRTPIRMRFYAPSANFLRNNIGNFGLRLIQGSGLRNSLLKDGLCVAPKFFSSISRKFFGENPCTTEVRLAWEQLPISTNRIELGTEKDANGIPRVKLFWEKQPPDRRTAEIAIQLFGSYFAKQGLGRVKMTDWLSKSLDYPENDEKAGFHHMGGTRMSESPSNGVVDRNCKVFDVDNLFIGGSSVFATGGHANPTYTTVQLALRLADHIVKLELKKK
jgi:hypothetical protein